MAGYVLHLSTEENITLSSATVKRLIAGGSGDAALLYLAILHARGAADSGKLARELGRNASSCGGAGALRDEARRRAGEEGGRPLPPPPAAQRAARVHARGHRAKAGGRRALRLPSARGGAQARPALDPVGQEAVRAVRKPRLARGRGLHARQLLHREKGAAVRRGAAAQHARDRKKRATSGRARSSFPSKRPAST